MDVSSPIRALSTGPNTSSRSKKRVLSDSEETVERELKRFRKVDGGVDKDQKSELRDRKRRRKKKRKLPVVQATDAGASDAEGRRTFSPVRRLRRRSLSSIAAHANQPQPSSTTQSRPTSVARQPSAGPSALPARTRSPSQSCDRPTPVSEVTSDKGKGRASPISMPDAGHSAMEVSHLNEQISKKAELISKHETLVSSFQQSLTCQICLDLMHKPYALAPCGHSACYDCLVSWFKAPPADVHPHDVVPAWLRKKTCPHCRAIVKERPVEVWAIKDMIAHLVKSGLASPPLLPAAPALDTAADPWTGIFRATSHHGHGMIFPDAPPPALLQQVMGVHDAEDGGIYRCVDCHHEIWDGACSQCGRVYPGHVQEGDEYDPDEDVEDAEAAAAWAEELEELEWDLSHNEEDDEQWDDHAMMQHLMMFGPPLLPPGHPHEEVDHGPYHEILGPHDRADPGEEDEDEEGEGGYESSFIDDEDDHGIPRHGGGHIMARHAYEEPAMHDDYGIHADSDDGQFEDDDDDDDDAVRFAGFRRANGGPGAPNRHHPIVISSDEEDDVEPKLNWGSRLVGLGTEDEDMEDEEHDHPYVFEDEGSDRDELQGDDDIEF
ncbi:hypothetical protein A0H81_13298 [Grifola frondosa]|uniref:RING-type domain-containing protein n=1 Tax=Grifola frondosa TaxID=5627 RepID=A0A1C7LSE5_GRIFR|nr:hypothetical protein A0H81_13298 [Grifola frondosa]